MLKLSKSEWTRFKKVDSALEKWSNGPDWNDTFEGFERALDFVKEKISRVREWTPQSSIVENSKDGVAAKIIFKYDRPPIFLLAKFGDKPRLVPGDLLVA